MDNADTWLEVLDLLAARRMPAIAYDQPGFGVAPPLNGGSVLDQLVDFGGARGPARRRAVGRAGDRRGQLARRLDRAAARAAEELPIAGVVAIGPAGIRMAPLFFTVDRIPAVSRMISLPAPVPAAVVRGVAGRIYRQLAFGDPAAMDQAIVDRFTRFTVGPRRAPRADRLREAPAGRPRRPVRPRADPRVPSSPSGATATGSARPPAPDRFAELLPHAQIEMLEGIGHCPQIECPDVVADAIELADGLGASARAGRACAQRSPANRMRARWRRWPSSLVRSALWAARSP